MEQSNVILDTPESIAKYRLFALHKAFAFESDSGLYLTRRMPRVQDVARLYKFEGVRTKRQLAEALYYLYKLVDNGEADYEIRDGVCFYSVGLNDLDGLEEAIKNA